MVKTYRPIHGTHYGEQGILTDRNPDAIKGYYLFTQKITLNPLSLSQNFKFRLRMWWYNQHAPATNTGMDFFNKIFIDYGDGQIFEYDNITDRTFIVVDYAQYVNDLLLDINELTEDTLNDLYSHEIEVKIWLQGRERTMGLYPDSIESLHSQRLVGRLGLDRTDIKMNTVFPKLTEVSEDIFYNFNYVEDRLFEGCDRLIKLPEKVFDTLVDQKTFDRWFKDSAIRYITNRHLEHMELVESANYMFYNSDIRTINDYMFDKFKYLNSYQYCFARTKVMYIGKDIISRDLINKEIDLEGMFSECHNLFIPYDYKFKTHFSAPNLRLKTYNMLGSVIVHNVDEELLKDLIWDGKPTLGIFSDEASTDTNGLNRYSMEYTAKGFIDLSDIRLCITSEGNITMTLENTSQLESRIVVEINNEKIGYDPKLLPKPIQSVRLQNLYLRPGDSFRITIYSSNDLIGVDFYEYIDGVDILKDITEDMSMRFSGTLPKSKYIARMVSLFSGLSYIETPLTMFKNYTSYNVESLFEGCDYLFQSDDFYGLFRPLVDQTTFKRLFKGNKSIVNIPNMFDTNNKVVNMESAFENMESLLNVDHRVFDYMPLLETTSKCFRNSKVFIVFDNNIDMLKNNRLLSDVSYMFENCEQVTRALDIRNNTKLTNLKGIYKNVTELSISRKKVTRIDKNSISELDSLTKIGRLIDTDYFPKFDSNVTSINMEEMFYNCKNISFFRHIFDSERFSGKSFLVDNMFYGSNKFLFSKDFIFNGVTIIGDPKIDIHIPVQTMKVKITDKTLRLDTLLREWGIPQVDGNGQLSEVSYDNTLFYPEYKGVIKIDWGDNKIEDINLSPKFRMKRSNKILKMSRIYEDVSGLDGISTISEDIQIFNKEYQPIVHIYDDYYLGKEVTIRLENRYIPLTVGNNELIEYDGELPYGRLELLDFSLWKNLKELKGNLFNNLFISTNTSLRHFDNTMIMPSTSYSMFNEFDNLEKVDENLFANLINLNSLGPIFTNCDKLYRLPFLWNNHKDIYLAELCYLGCSNLEVGGILPSSVKVMYGIYAYTNILTAPYSHITESPNLVRACHVFAGCTSNTNKLEYDQFSNVSNLKKIPYTFRDAQITEIASYSFRNSVKLETILGLFSNSRLSKVTDNYFVNCKALTDITDAFNGSNIENYQHMIGGGYVTTADGLFENTPIKDINENIFRNNTKINSLARLFKGSSIGYSPKIFNGLRDLRVISEIFRDCQNIENINSEILLANPNIVTARYAFANTSINTIPENIFINIEDMLSIKGLFKDCKDLLHIKHTGLSINYRQEVLDMSYMFDGCVFDFGYNKFTSLISSNDENNLPAINIHNSLRNIPAKYTDLEMADNTFTIIGESNAIYTPDPSEDTYGLNMMIFKFNLSNKTKLSFKVYDYKDNKMIDIIKADGLQKTDRLIVDINGDITALDKSINPLQLLPSVELGVGNHVIKIYTQGKDKKDFSSTVESDLVIPYINGINLTLEGNLPVSAIDDNRCRKLKLMDIFKDMTVSDISKCIFNSNDPEDRSFLSRGFFSSTNITKIDISDMDVLPENLYQLFFNCKNLEELISTKPMRFGNTKPINCEEMFKGCIKLKTLPNKPISKIFDHVVKGSLKTTIILPINYKSMFEGCTSLEIAPKVIDFQYGTNKIEFSPTFQQDETFIDCTAMFKGCSKITEVPSEFIIDKVNSYTNSTPTYVLTSMYESCSSLRRVMINGMVFNRISNASRFNKMFYNCLSLETIYKPLITAEFSQVYFDTNNYINLEYMFARSVKLEWGRTKISTLIKFPNILMEPSGYNAYGMLENIESNIKDDDIFAPDKYIGPTLANYVDKGPSVKDMNKLTMWFDMIKSYDGQNWGFSIWGPVTNGSKYMNLTGSNSKNINGRIVVVYNDKDGSEDAIEYSFDNPVRIESFSVGEPDTPYADLPDYNGKKVVRIKIDIYTESKVQDFLIHEFMGSVQPSTTRDCVNIMINGSLGYSEHFKSKGVLLTDILDSHMIGLLTYVDKDLMNRYTEIGYTVDSNGYHKSILADCMKIEKVPLSILKPLSGSINGAFSGMNIKEFEDTEFTNESITELNYLLYHSNIGAGFTLKPFINVIKLKETFALATNTNSLDISTLFEFNTKLSELDGTFAGSYLENLHIDMFRHNPELTILKDTFMNNRIVNLPNIFFSNNKLTTVEGVFERTKINKIPDEIFANKSNLINTSRAFKDTNITSIPLVMFKNSPNIRIASKMFMGCKQIKLVSKTFFDSLVNLENSESMFEECVSIYKLENESMDSLVNLINSSRMFYGCSKIAIIPDKLLYNLSSLEDASYMFGGRGSLGYVGTEFLPNTSSIKNLSGLFYNQINLPTIDKDIFKNQINLENISGLFELCTSLESIDGNIFSNNTKLIKADRAFKDTKLNHIPDNLFINSINLISVDECFMNCGSVELIGSNIFKFNRNNNISLKRCFSGLVYTNLYYRDISNIIHNIDEFRVNDNKLDVTDAFKGVMSFLTEESFVESDISHIGETGIVTVPAPSIDTTNMNFIGYDIKINATDEYSKTLNIYSIEVLGLATTSNDFVGRVVIEIDGVKKSYDKQIYPGEPVKDIVLTKDTVVKIYTSSEEDLVLLYGTYNLKTSGNETIEYTGTINKSISKLSNATLTTLGSMLYSGTERRIYDFKVISIPPGFIKNIVSLPTRKVSSNEIGFLSSLYVNEIPSGLFVYDNGVNVNSKTFINLFRGSRMTVVHDNSVVIPSLETAEGMFELCRNLTTVKDIFGGKCGRIRSFNNMFKTTSKLETIHEGLFRDIPTDTTADLMFSASNIEVDPLLYGFSGNIISAYQMFGLANCKRGLLDKSLIRKLLDANGMYYGARNITEIPDDYFRDSYLLKVVTSCFGNLKSDTPITINKLGISPSITDISNLFYESNINWSNKLASKVIWSSTPSSATIRDSFYNVHVNWDNDTQLFAPISKLIEESKAIFDGRIIPPTDIDGLNCLEYMNIPNLETDANYIGVDLELIIYDKNLNKMVKLQDTSQLTGRLVVKYSAHKLTETGEVTSIGYDHSIEHSIISKIPIRVNEYNGEGLTYSVQIYTETDLVFISGKIPNGSIRGTLPKGALIGSNKIVPLVDIFRHSTDDVYYHIESDILANLGIKWVDLSNNPFQHWIGLVAPLSSEDEYFDNNVLGLCLTEQESLDDAFRYSSLFGSCLYHIFKNKPKLKSAKYTFAENISSEKYIGYDSVLDLGISKYNASPFRDNPLLETTAGMFYKANLLSDINTQLFDSTSNTLVKDVSYMFAYVNSFASITTKNIFSNLMHLENISGVFRNTTIPKIESIGCIATCYEIGRSFFECKTSEILSSNLVNTIYNGTPPVDSVTLLDCFYNVPVRAKSEAEFIDGIRFFTGATGAKFSTDN